MSCIVNEFNQYIFCLIFNISFIFINSREYLFNNEEYFKLKRTNIIFIQIYYVRTLN